MDAEVEVTTAILDAVTGEGIVGTLLTGAAGWIILQGRRINRRLNAAYRLALVQTPVLEQIAVKLDTDDEDIKKMMFEYDTIERERTAVGVKIPGT